MTKKVYRVRNWPEYNKSLVQRGSLTLLVNEEVISQWYAQPTGKPGRPLTYSDTSIECCALLRLWFNKGLRATQGLMMSLLALLNLDVEVPCFTQISRRTGTLKTKLRHNVRGHVYVVLDGSGLKMYGEGEWKVRQHGYSKRRMWRKLHLGVEVGTQEVVMMELTDNHIGENKLLPSLLDQYEGTLSKVGGDKGYDSFACHEEIGRRGAESAILIQRKSVIRRRKREEEPTLVRDDIVRCMRAIGREGWKVEVDYHKRSLVETAFSRFKRLFGDKLPARKLENQKMEALLACNLLNRFTQLGMPDTVRT